MQRRGVTGTAVADRHGWVEGSSCGMAGSFFIVLQYMMSFKGNDLQGHLYAGSTIIPDLYAVK